MRKLEQKGPMTRKNNTITCKVKQYRLARGWSQEKLAEEINVRRQAVYDIESGRYLPNTAIALRLARIFNCRVEDLFAEQEPPDTRPVHIINGQKAPSSRLALGMVRDRLVGISLQGPESVGFGLRPADGILTPDGKNAQIFSPSNGLDKTSFQMAAIRP